MFLSIDFVINDKYVSIPNCLCTRIRFFLPFIIVIFYFYFFFLHLNVTREFGWIEDMFWDIDIRFVEIAIIIYVYVVGIVRCGKYFGNNFLGYAKLNDSYNSKYAKLNDPNSSEFTSILNQISFVCLFSFDYSFYYVCVVFHLLLPK